MPESPLWTGKKRTLFGLPWSFTTYTLTDNCLFIRSGLLTVREEDVTLRRSFRERLFGLGTIHLCTSDQSTPEIDIRRIKNAREVRTILSDRAEIERSSKLEGMRELMSQATGADSLQHH